MSKTPRIVTQDVTLLPSENVVSVDFTRKNEVLWQSCTDHHSLFQNSKFILFDLALAKVPLKLRWQQVHLKRAPGCYPNVTLARFPRSGFAHSKTKIQSSNSSSKTALRGDRVIMARLNIEDQFDLEVMAVAAVNGIDIDKLAGNAIRFFRYAQTKHKTGEYVSESEFEGLGFLEALFPMFAKRTPNGIECAGAKKYFGWLDQKIEAGRVGGQKSAAARKAKLGSAQPRFTRSEVEAKPSDAEPSSSSSSSLNEEEEAKIETLKKKRVAVPFHPKTSDELWDGMSETKKSLWLDLYPDPEFLSRTNKKAFSYYTDDKPQDEPRSKSGWTRALNHWFDTGWATYRKNKQERGAIESKRPTGGMDFIQLTNHLYAAVKRFGAYDTDERKAAIVGEHWDWVSRSGIFRMIREQPDNDWTRKAIARQLKDAYEARAPEQAGA